MKKRYEKKAIEPKPVITAEMVGILFTTLEEYWSDQLMASQYELDKAWETIEHQAEQIQYLNEDLDNLYEANESLSNELNGKAHGNAKLTPTDVQYINLMLSKGVSTTNIGKIFDVHPRTIRHIKNKTNWKNL